MEEGRRHLEDRVDQVGRHVVVELGVARVVWSHVTQDTAYGPLVYKGPIKKNQGARAGAGSHLISC